MNSLITSSMYTITQALFDVVVLIIMIFAAIDDAKTRIVKPRFQLLLLAVSILHLGFEFFAFPHNLWEHGLNCLLGGIIMFAIYITLVLIFKSGIGGADTKVTSTLTLYLGLLEGIIMVVGHLLSGLIYAGFSKVVLKKHVGSVPLMVFILIGFIIAKIFYWICYFAVGLM